MGGPFRPPSTGRTRGESATPTVPPRNLRMALLPLARRCNAGLDGPEHRRGGRPRWSARRMCGRSSGAETDLDLVGGPDPYAGSLREPDHHRTLRPRAAPPLHERVVVGASDPGIRVGNVARCVDRDRDVRRHEDLRVGGGRRAVSEVRRGVGGLPRLGRDPVAVRRHAATRARARMAPLGVQSPRDRLRFHRLQAPSLPRGA